MKNGIIFMLIMCLGQISQAQKEGNNWYFGKNAGLNFNTTPPTPVTGVLYTDEGCASISDPVTGELLMYTDGIRVRDRNHNVMPANVANALRGHWSSTQSALIVPQPGSNTRYYIFTTVAQAFSFYYPPALYYSVVDLSLNGGNGDLVSWNNILIDTTTEKLTAVGNCDGSRFWIVGHKWNCDSFYAFQLTSTGLSAPVKSKAGLVHTTPTGSVNTEATGYMKFSPDGKKIGLVIPGQPNKVEIFDFDFNTGTIANPVTDLVSLPAVANEGVYGCSFSPDGSKFYVSAFVDPMARKVFQYDMNAGSAAAILASRADVALQSDTTRTAGALQIGPDGKMYVVTLHSNSVDVIHNPNAAGAACNYEPKAIYLAAGSEGRLGLPCFAESLLASPAIPEFKLPGQRSICPGDTVWATQDPHTFTITPATNVWVSTDSTLVSFSPDTTTTYTVISSSPCTVSDTAVFTVYVSKGPAAAFVFNPEDPQPADISLTLANQSSQADSYQWFDAQGTFLSSAKDHILPHPGLGKFCYTLVATDSVGCKDTAERCISIEKHGPLFIPNSFSPNGDGLNDIFRVYGLYRDLLEFSVFNRYGERIFHTTDMGQGWNGQYKAKLCDAGTYYYLIRLVNGNGEKETRKGNINLVF
jgi:gliding motility-associated-like protein